ncbi:MAG: pentapeptide repeat-containing protein [Planctomycetes bacterium]|nr:pentapeptide repeat-containing protein [Planctomycetota bacterium]
MPEQITLDKLSLSAEEFRSWRKDHPGATVFPKSDFKFQDLSGFDLSGVDLQDAKLAGANLSGCSLRGARLSGADLTGAMLLKTDLTNADLSVQTAIENNRRFLREAITWAQLAGIPPNEDARSLDALTHVNEITKLNNAVLFGANLSGARLGYADLTGVDLREVEGLELDNNRIKDARFSSNATDKWSVLRRSYTGPKLILNLLLLLAFIVPFIVLAVFLTVVERGERFATDINSPIRAEVRKGTEMIAAATRKISSELTDAAKQVSTMAEVAEGLPLEQSAVAPVRSIAIDLRELEARIKGVSNKVSDSGERTAETVDSTIQKLQPTEKNGWKPEPVWWMLLGGLDGGWSMMITFLLIVYNISRGWLTYNVSFLREDEQRSQVSPSHLSLRIAWNVHTWIVTPLKYLALALFILHLLSRILTTVMVPPGFTKEASKECAREDSGLTAEVCCRSEWWLGGSA